MKHVKNAERLVRVEWVDGKTVVALSQDREKARAKTSAKDLAMDAFVDEDTASLATKALKRNSRGFEWTPFVGDVVEEDGELYAEWDRGEGRIRLGTPGTPDRRAMMLSGDFACAFFGLDGRKDHAAFGFGDEPYANCARESLRAMLEMTGIDTPAKMARLLREAEEMLEAERDRRDRKASGGAPTVREMLDMVREDALPAPLVRQKETEDKE